MKDNAQKIFVLFMILGNKVSQKDAVEKVYKTGKEKWILKESKKWKRTYDVYFGKLKYIYFVLIGIGAFFFMNSLTKLNTESQETLIYMFVLSSLLIFIGILGALVQRNLKKQMRTFLNNLTSSDRNVTLEDDRLTTESKVMATSWDMNNLKFMIETMYGYLLIFEDSAVSFVDIMGQEGYDELNKNLRDYADDKKYIPMYKQL